MSDEKDDKEFEIRLAEKNHKELKKELSFIATALSKDNDGRIIAAIEKQTAAINSFSFSLKELPKPEQPKVSVEVNQDKVISSIERMVNKITDSNSELLLELKKYNDRPMLESFKVSRDQYGNTKSIDLVYKKKQ